ncbi:18417_t:CDS:2, partial [Rhizophagus irregularis]
MVVELLKDGIITENESDFESTKPNTEPKENPIEFEFSDNIAVEELLLKHKLQHETAENPKDQEAPTIFQNVSSVKKHFNSLMISKRLLIWKRTESEQHARE